MNHEESPLPCSKETFASGLHLIHLMYKKCRGKLMTEPVFHNMKDFQLCCIWWRPWWHQGRACPTCRLKKTPLPHGAGDSGGVKTGTWFQRSWRSGVHLSFCYVILGVFWVCCKELFFLFVLYVLNCFWTVWTLLVCDLCSARLPKDIEQENIQAECCRASCTTIWNFRCSQHVSYMRSWHGNVMNYVYCCIC